MPYPSYPTADDLGAFLTAAGITLSAALTAQLEPAIAAGIEGFEKAVHGKMLAEAPATIRKFAVPLHGATLTIPWLAAEPETIAFVPVGGTEEEWALDTDYWCEPGNALARGKPITSLRLKQSWYGVDDTLRRAVQIEGLWGYSTQLPADAHRAMLAGAALDLWESITLNATGGRLSVREGDASIDYGVERWSKAATAWKTQYDRAVAAYRRLGF
jgi:hypothetical protein